MSTVMTTEKADRGWNPNQLSKSHHGRSQLAWPFRRRLNEGSFVNIKLAIMWNQYCKVRSTMLTRLCNMYIKMAGEITSMLYFFVSLIFIQTNTSQCLNTQTGYLDGHVFQSLEISSAIVCGAKCLERINCMSFNFHSTIAKCELNDATAEEFPADFRIEEGTKYLPRQLEEYQVSEH